LDEWDAVAAVKVEGRHLVYSFLTRQLIQMTKGDSGKARKDIGAWSRHERRACELGGCRCPGKTIRGDYRRSRPRRGSEQHGRFAAVAVTRYEDPGGRASHRNGRADSRIGPRGFSGTGSRRAGCVETCTPRSEVRAK